MRFSAVILSAVGFTAFAVATTTTSPVPTPTTSYSSTVNDCLNKCTVGDVNCQATCLGNPTPNESQVNDTTKCAAACKQGNGTADDTAKYAACQQACITSHFLAPTQASGSGSGSDNNSAGATTTPPPSSTPTGGSSGSSSNSTAGSGKSGSKSSASGGAKTSSGSGTETSSEASGFKVAGSVMAAVAVLAAALTL